MRPDQINYGAPSGRSLIPSKSTMEHLKVGLELLLLLLAVPWLLRELFRNPGGLSRRAASKHLKG